MYEKVNPAHPDKVADRIAGALVDQAYSKADDARIAVEVLIGHGICDIIAETTVPLDEEFVRDTVRRIAGKVYVDYREYFQDPILSRNQRGRIRCGDNGIFRGVPVSREQRKLAAIAVDLYKQFPHDGKYILDCSGNQERLIVCQSNAGKEALELWLRQRYEGELAINPLGYWTGGTDVDSGATNRKLGSDMGDAVTGGGLHGKDLSKADVSVNIYAYLKAQETGRPVELFCAIGDEYVDGKPYGEIVEIARQFIMLRGGFEKFAEWGLI